MLVACLAVNSPGQAQEAVMLDNLSLLQGLPFYKLAFPAALALSVLFMRMRAGSSYLLLDRLLRLVFGKIEIYDSELRKQVEETHDLEQIRIRVGLRVTNMASLKRLLAWTKSNGVGLHELGAVRSYVRPDTPGIIVRPLKLELWAGGAIVLGGLVMGAMLFYLAVVPVALTTSNATGRAYLMAQDHGERFSLFSTQFTVNSCATGLAKSEPDQEICGFLADPHYKEFVTGTIREQRKIALILLLITSPMTWLFGGLFFEIRRAMALSDRIYGTSTKDALVDKTAQ